MLSSFRELGYRVGVIMASDGDSGAGDTGFETYPVPLPSAGPTRMRFLIFTWKGFLKGVRLRPDILLASDLYSLPLVVFLSFFTRSRVVYDSRELYTAIAALRHRRFTQRFWSVIESVFIRRAALVLCVNNSLGAMLQKLYPRKKIVVVRNIPRKERPQRTDRLRSMFPIRADQKILLYQGGLQSGRGIPVILKIAPELQNAAFVFMGDGLLKTDILTAAKNSPNIFHLPAVPADQVLDYTASADIGLTLIEDHGTSYYYSLPNKLFEYIRAGLPVVGSNFPEIGAIINEYEIGATAPPGNPELVRDAISGLMQDDDRLKRCRANCVRASAALLWDEEFKRFRSALDQLMDND